MNFPPRLPLAHLPTPLEPLPRLSERLGGAEIWIKRDDQTGLAGGGNKTRKLEFLIADARSRGAHTVITGGAPQSNHCRQTAAACARAGLRCILVLGGRPPAAITGNILLDELLGASLVWSGDRPREAVMQATCDDEAAAGRDPLLIPIGGSNALGAAAYAAAVKELVEQMRSLPPSLNSRAGGRAEDGGQGFSRICFASSSGGTHAGLAVGGRVLLPETEVLGISVDTPLELLRATVAQLATQTAGLLGLPESFGPGDISASADYIGLGYAKIGERERETIRLLGRCEGILLDPVYTAKAFGGMVDLIRRGVIGRDERVLFWHTGGQPALFAFAEEL
jgi:D-cysteine desulfhydrase